MRAQRRRGGACCNSAAVHHMLGLVGPQQKTHGCKSHGGERCQYLCNYVHAMCSNQQAHLHALSHTRQLMLCIQDTAKQAQNTAKQVTPPASRAPRRLHTVAPVAASSSTPYHMHMSPRAPAQPSPVLPHCQPSGSAARPWPCGGRGCKLLLQPTAPQLPARWQPSQENKHVTSRLLGRATRKICMHR